MDTYPPLRALLAFDAAMRTGSFALAATELCVTPGAIGQQIQKLEAWLELPLFTRQTRQILPTADAHAYWQELRPALARIRESSLRLRKRRSQEVSLSMPPSLAAKWFPQRMARLLLSQPQLQLHLSASAVPVDFEREVLDLAIRYFDGNDARLDATRLHADEARLYCSPEYAEKLALRQPGDVLRTVLLVSSQPNHTDAWLTHFVDAQGSTLSALPQIRFDQALLAIEAAKQHQGAVITSPHLTEADLRSGALIEPFAARLPLQTAYYVVHARGRPLRPAAAALKHWLLTEALAD